MTAKIPPCLTCDRPTARLIYFPNHVICSTCAQTLTADQAAAMTKALNSSRIGAKIETKANHRAAHRDRLLASIALSGKRCTSCHWHKPAGAYAVCEMRGDGLQLECRECMRLRTAIAKASGGKVSTWHAIRDALRSQAGAQTK